MKKKFVNTWSEKKKTPQIQNEKKNIKILKMPGLIGIFEFVDETREDHSSPTTSTFVSKMPQCRQTILALEDVSFIYLFYRYSVEKKHSYEWMKWRRIGVVLPLIQILTRIIKRSFILLSSKIITLGEIPIFPFIFYKKTQYNANIIDDACTLALKREMFEENSKQLDILKMDPEKKI